MRLYEFSQEELADLERGINWGDRKFLPDLDRFRSQDWIENVIDVLHLEVGLDDGDDMRIRAYLEGKLPFSKLNPEHQEFMQFAIDQVDQVDKMNKVVQHDPSRQASTFDANHPGRHWLNEE